MNLQPLLKKIYHKEDFEANGLKDLKLYEIAILINESWKKPYFGAVPYIQALNYLSTIDNTYIMDSGRSIVAYLLSNMSTFRGPYARAIKKELNKRLKRY